MAASLFMLEHRFPTITQFLTELKELSTDSVFPFSLSTRELVTAKEAFKPHWSKSEKHNQYNIQTGISGIHSEFDFICNVTIWRASFRKLMLQELSGGLVYQELYESWIIIHQPPYDFILC